MRRAGCLVAAALCLPNAFAQLIAQTVMVGANGSFFEPDTVSAGANDIVRFLFVGPSHSVVQSSFDSPCSQLPGGFSSGVAGVGNSSVGVTPPVWDLQITNDTLPIWFYCANTLPSFHCTAGMVGVINPPSIPQFNQFLAAAKLVTAVPTIFPTKGLIGQGATATGFPVAPSTASTTTTSTSSSSTTSTSSTTESSTPTLTPTPSPASSSNKGAIIGGSIGGALALVGVILLVWFCLARRKSQRERNSSDFFNYNVRPPQRDISKVAAGLPTLAHIQADHHAPPSTQPSQSNLSESAPTLTPLRRDSSGRQYRIVNDTVSTASNASRGLPPLPPLPAVVEQKSFLTLQSPSTSISTAHDGPPANIQLLASQVAAVMMQNTLDARAGARRRSGSMDDGASAPPSYVVHH